jgi:hypothetical protein
MNTKRKK